MNYTPDDLFVLGKRYGNPKRSYLLIDPLQAKHLAVSPSKTLSMMNDLGAQLAANNPQTGCIIGFAETATAIAAAAALHFSPETVFVTTTREPRKASPYIMDFSEEHSHAVSQLLDISLIAKHLKFNLLNDRSVMLIDDEISTGKTARNIINALNQRLPTLERYGRGFVIGSVINRMSDEQRNALKAENIAFDSLIYMDESDLEERVSAFEVEKPSETDDLMERNFSEIDLSETAKIPDPRKGGLFVHDLRMWLNAFVNSAYNALTEFRPVKADEKVLFLGTEECMIPAIMLGAEYEQRTNAAVFSHSTTRSPIGISRAEGYPVFEGYRIASFYEANRETYVYDPLQYDLVVVVTDSKDASQRRKAMTDVTKVFDKSKDFVIINA